MGYYILKRLISIVPFALLAILLVFMVFEVSWEPDLSRYRSNQHGISLDNEKLDEIKCELRREMNLDLPLFYLSVSSSAIPQDILKICNEQSRELLKRLCYENGNIAGAEKVIDELERNNLIDEIYHEEIEDVPARLKNTVLANTFDEYLDKPSKHRVFLPRIEFHGTQNRFHIWISKLLALDLGRSTLNNQLVSEKINKSILKTLSFTIPAVVLIFLLAILIGYFLSYTQPYRKSIVSNLLYLIDAIPLVWLSIIILLIAGTLGVGYSTLDYGSSNLWQSLSGNSLPILALIMAATPYVSKQVQNAIVETKKKPFVLAAQAKGLNDRKIFWRHILPNASIPIVTLFFDYMALAFGGAFVVEWVFSISGVGKLMADSVLADDLPVISGIIIYLIIIKMLLTLFSDITNYLINPSIKF